MFEHSLLWGITVILGPVLFVAMMTCGVIGYNRRSPAKRHEDDMARAVARRELAEVMEEIASPPLAPWSLADERSSSRGVRPDLSVIECFETDGGLNYESFRLI